MMVAGRWVSSIPYDEGSSPIPEHQIDLCLGKIEVLFRIQTKLPRLKYLNNYYTSCTLNL